MFSGITLALILAAGRPVAPPKMPAPMMFAGEWAGKIVALSINRVNERKVKFALKIDGRKRFRIAGVAEASDIPEGFSGDNREIEFEEPPNEGATYSVLVYYYQRRECFVDVRIEEPEQTRVRVLVSGCKEPSGWTAPILRRQMKVKDAAPR